MRRRRAEERRAVIADYLDANPVAEVFPRGLPVILAQALGVHRSTAWRDLQRILYPPCRCEIYHDGQLLCTIARECPGGPVVSVTDWDGNEIRGKAHRAILRQMPRYWGKRR